MNFITAVKREAFARALCKAVGFDLDAACDAGDTDAFRRFVSAKNPNVKDIQTIKAEHARLTAENAQKRAELARVQASTASVKAELEKTVAKHPDIGASIAAADAKVEQKAIEMLSKHGVNVGSQFFVADREHLTKAQFDRLSPKEKTKFSVRGGRIIES